jgi:hypothetical protein
LGLLVRTYGQGAIFVENYYSYYGLCEDQAGNYYDGTFGLDVWFKNGTSYNLNTVNQYLGANPLAAYSLLVPSGFTKVATYIGAETDSAAIFSLGELDIAGVNPAGSTITLALAAWKGGGSTFLGASKAGVLAFRNGTSDYTPQPQPVPWTLSDGWNSVQLDLTMSVITVPEPGSLTLLGMSSVVLVMVRRRK